MNEIVLVAFRDEMEKTAQAVGGLKAIGKLWKGVLRPAAGQKAGIGKRFATAVKGTTGAGRRELRTHGLRKLVGPAKVVGGVGALVGAPMAVGAYMSGRKQQREQAFRRKLTGSYRPGAGMLVPPRAY